MPDSTRSRRFGFSMLAGLLALCLLGGCGGGGGGGDAGAGVGAADSQWDVMKWDEGRWE